jgi:hypothetical protein
MISSGKRAVEIAAATGITNSRLCEYALGHRPIPANRLIILAEYFQCNPSDLLGSVDEEEISWNSHVS